MIANVLQRRHREQRVERKGHDLHQIVQRGLANADTEVSRKAKRGGRGWRERIKRDQEDAPVKVARLAQTGHQSGDHSQSFQLHKEERE